MTIWVCSQKPLGARCFCDGNGDAVNLEGGYEGAVPSIMLRLFLRLACFSDGLMNRKKTHFHQARKIEKRTAAKASIEPGSIGVSSGFAPAAHTGTAFLKIST